MLSIGASNPMAEFERFIGFTEGFVGLNPHLEIVNGCVGGTGIQEMNWPDFATNAYWLNVMDVLEAKGLTADQVQVCWIEEENTMIGDTVFPTAPINLINEYHELLQIIKILFPKTQIVYASARVYSGFAVPEDTSYHGGLEFPRDYLNGWTVKWLIENVIDNEPGYDYEGVDATIPLLTWGTYHWTDGSVVREDGLFLNCEEDLSPDGLHLSNQGDYKIGEMMFNYYKTDTTARGWFYDSEFSGIKNNNSEIGLNIFPNPVTANTIHFNSDDLSINENVNIVVCSIDGKVMFNDWDNYQPDMAISLPDLNSGFYILSVRSENNFSTGKFFIADLMN